MCFLLKTILVCPTLWIVRFIKCTEAFGFHSAIYENKNSMNNTRSRKLRIIYYPIPLSTFERIALHVGAMKVV